MKDYIIYLSEKRNHIMQRKEKKKDKIFFLKLQKNLTSLPLNQRSKKSKLN